MIGTLLALVPAFMPLLQGPLPTDRVDTYDSLISEYKRASLDWRRAKRAAEKEDRIESFDLEHPTLTFYARFDTLAKNGGGHALLWTGIYVGDMPVTAGEAARIKREAFRRVADEFAKEDYAVSLADQLDRQDEWLTDEEVVALLERLYTNSDRPKVQATAGYKLARRLEQMGTEADLTRAHAWYEKVVAGFETTREASKAAGRLRGLTTAVGRQAPEFDAEDVDGNAFQLSDYRGKVVVLDFWGFW